MMATWTMQKTSAPSDGSQSVEDAAAALRSAVQARQGGDGRHGRFTVRTNGDGSVTIDGHGLNASLPGAPGAPGAPGIPGRGYQGPPDIPPGVQETVKDVSFAFFLMLAVIIVGWRVAHAFGKRFERSRESAALLSGTSSQLQRIEQSIDAMAIEIERISESQRFIAKLQSAVPERTTRV